MKLSSPRRWAGRERPTYDDLLVEAMVLAYVTESGTMTIPQIARDLDVAGAGYAFDAVERAIVELVRNRILRCEGPFLLHSDSPPGIDL